MADIPRLAIRGPALSFRDDPFHAPTSQCLDYQLDALILVEAGKIQAVGPYAQLRDQLQGLAVHHYPGHLILPGFIDSHVHYPQLQIIGSYGRQLIDWLNHYTFVSEQQFDDADHARLVSDFFLQSCLLAGTTTAAVFCTVHPASVEGFFAAAQARGMRMIAGKVWMDRHAPAELLDTAQSAYDDSEALIERWHGQGRLHYAITPRFAPTSTPAQLEAAGALWRRHPSCYVQTHLNESPAEVDWVRRLYPTHQHYLDVYAQFGLVGPRAVFGHAIHLDEAEWQLLAESGSSIAHCPSSNAFLGSGLFDFRRAFNTPARIPVGLASDVGAGTSLSLLRNMGAAYQVAQLGGYSLSPAQAFYLATLGAARALHLDDRIGRIAPGYEADMVVLDLKSTPLIDFRMQHCDTLEEALFIQMTLADERATAAVYVAGERVVEDGRFVAELAALN